MYRIIFLIYFFPILLPSILYAQENRGQRVSVNISAEVINSIELITVRTITFENSGRSGGLITINPVNSGRAGKMIAQGTPGANFRLTFLRERDLVNTPGNQTIIFRYLVSGNVEDDQGTSELLEDDNRSLQFSESGQYYIWVGGEVNLQKAAPGNYEGEFTLEIEYI